VGGVLRLCFAGRRVALDTEHRAHGLPRLALASRAQREQRRSNAENRDDGRDPPGLACHSASLRSVIEQRGFPNPNDF
jgi:hypothetical protein